MKDYFSGGSLTGFDYVPLDIGRAVGDNRYEIQSQPIMGKVKAIYRARDRRLKRDVILAHYWAKGEDAWHIREQEAVNLSKLNHPSIIKLLDTGKTEKGVAYLVLEYIYGPTLAMVMRDERRLDLERAVEIFAQISSGLSYIHKQGMIHGAVKANHIMIDQNGPSPDLVRIIDLAQARPTGHARLSNNVAETFQLVGSPSPEELRGQPLDARSDIYALGCLLYKVLTGKAPFSGSSADEIATKHIGEFPAPLKEAHPQGIFSPGLEKCVQRTLEKDPNRRFGSTDEFIAEFRQSVSRARG